MKAEMRNVKFQKITLLIISVLFVLPSAALANMGSVLLIATVVHLFIGNVFIGIVEGLILSKVFKLKKLKTILLLILANYFSAWLGYVLINFQIDPLFNLHNVRFMLYVFIVVAYLLTILIEWPFIAILFKGDTRWLSKSIKGCILVQTISYILLCSGYWIVRTTPFYKETKIVQLSNMELPENVMVYYVDDSDGDVYGGLLGGEKEKIFDLNSIPEDRLVLWPDFLKSAELDLVAGFRGGSYDWTVIQKSIAAKSDYSLAGSSFVLSFQKYITAEAERLAEARDSHWNFNTRWWLSEGLVGLNMETEERVRINYEIPAVMWNARRATHLPDDKVIFQFGKRQICIYDVVKKEIALVAYGRDPVAVLRK